MSIITKVVLYKHGVGYFEREASVTGNAEVRLGFKTEEMNDVLKSLTVFDSSGGTVSSVSYDNQKPISKLLEESSLNIPSDGGGTALLGSIRGASVMVSAGSRMVTGQVVGVEERSVQVAGGVATISRLTIFDDSGALHGFDVQEISQVRFLDEHLKGELKHLFETLLSATKRDSKNLTLFAKGDGERTLAISYVVECPVWKTSYRIAISSEEKESPYLQGWALVDNPQDQDWKDVELSLVSGLPISFRHDLYSPRYLRRTEVEVEREAAAAPVVTQPVMRRGVAAPSGIFKSAAPVIGGGGIADEIADYGAADFAVASAAPMRGGQMAVSQKVETVTQSVGQLFEYKIEQPVTVLRNQSALGPIVGSPFQGRCKILYNPRNREDNPFAVIDFRNTTGLTLEGGPLTVFEDEVYAGEAMLNTLSPDEETLVPYAVDLSVEAQRVEEHEEQVRLETLKDGLWTQRKARYTMTRYRFHNKSDKAKELIIEHAISPGKLVRTPEPLSQTRNLWRFGLTLPPKASVEFPVTARLDEEFQQSLLEGDPHWVLSLLSSSRSQGKLHSLLQELQEAAQELSETQRLEQALRQRVADLVTDQGRLRENLSKLGPSHDEARLRSRYVAEMERQEDDMARLASEIVAIGVQRKERLADLRDLVGRVSFEEAFEEL